MFISYSKPQIETKVKIKGSLLWFSFIFGSVKSLRPRTSRSDIVTLDQNVLAMLVSTPRFLDMKHYLEPFFGHLKKSQRIPNGDSPYGVIRK